jgi:hypothetical protein
LPFLLAAISGATITCRRTRMKTQCRKWLITRLKHNARAAVCLDNPNAQPPLRVVVNAAALRSARNGIAGRACVPQSNANASDFAVTEQRHEQKTCVLENAAVVVRSTTLV